MRPPRPAPAPVPCRRPVPCGAHMARRPVSLPPSVLSVFAKTFPFRPKKVPRFFGRPPFLCYLCIRFRPQAGRVPAGASFFERIYIKDREKVVQESGIPPSGAAHAVRCGGVRVKGANRRFRSGPSGRNAGKRCICRRMAAMKGRRSGSGTTSACGVICTGAFASRPFAFLPFINTLQWRV